MDYNPYAPPAAAPTVSTVPALATGAPLPWAIGEVVSAAWQKWKPAALPLTAAAFVSLAVEEAFSNIPLALISTRVVSAKTGQILNWVFLLPSIALSAYFMAGITRMTLDAARGAPVGFADIFREVRATPAMLAYTLLFYLAVGVASFACVLPAFPVAAALGLAPLFIIENRLGAVRALRESIAVTTGVRWRIAGLFIVTFLFMMLGLAACGVGFFVAYPLSCICIAIVYLRQTGRAI